MEATSTKRNNLIMYKFLPYAKQKIKKVELIDCRYYYKIIDGGSATTFSKKGLVGHSEVECLEKTPQEAVELFIERQKRIIKREQKALEIAEQWKLGREEDRWS
jgi:hypothetical protein